MTYDSSISSYTFITSAAMANKEDPSGIPLEQAHEMIIDKIFLEL